MPRPHLQELIAYIQQHPNLDVAIISGATREYIDTYLGMVAPALLAMCQFIWSREDKESFYKRGGGTTYKTLEHIPELKGYRAGRILMVEHGDVLPTASHLHVPPFYGEDYAVAELQNEHELQDVIRRLTILTQVDDIITLRKNEDAEREQYLEKVNAWQKQHNISMFDADYVEKMRACPIQKPFSIDEIKASAMEDFTTGKFLQFLEGDINHHPERLTAISSEQFRRIQDLVDGVDVGDINEKLPEDDQ